MFTMDVPKAYWDDVVPTTAYLINCMSLTTLNFNSPVQLNQGSNSYIIPPKIFVCVCFVHKYIRGKIDPRTVKSVSVGYSATQRGISIIIHPLENFM